MNYKGRVYGEREKKVIPTHDGMYRLEIEPVMHKDQVYENNIKDLIEEIETGWHRANPFNIQSFILEDGRGAKYEMHPQDDGTVLVDELDSDGNTVLKTRRYTKECLAKLIYTNHFGFSMTASKEAIKWGPEVYEYELAKYWN